MKLSLFLICAVTLHAQAPEPLAAMQDSIARQLASVQKQSEHNANSGFFLLPPPAKMGSTLGLTAFDCEPLPDPEVDALVNHAAKQEGLDPDLLRHVLKQESQGRPCALSAKGAMGLMQLMPATAADFGVIDAFDPYSNVGAGAKFLKELLNRYGGDLGKALGAYNAGPARVDALNGIPPIPETLDYVNRIFDSLTETHSSTY